MGKRRQCESGIKARSRGAVARAIPLGVENGGVGEEHVTQFKTGNDAVQALVSGKVDAVIIDNEPAKSYVSVNEGLTILDTAYTEEEYAICVAKENTALLEAIDSALASLKAEGKIDEVIGKYIAK